MIELSFSCDQQDFDQLSCFLRNWYKEEHLHWHEHEVIERRYHVFSRLTNDEYERFKTFTSLLKNPIKIKWIKNTNADI